MTITSHILVCRAFHQNFENKPFINHKNCIRHDNRPLNLEWCTHKENSEHASINDRMSRSKFVDSPKTDLAPGTALKKIRVFLGLTQEQFSKILKIKRSLLGAYEEGRALPREAMVLSICESYKIPISEFYSGSITQLKLENTLTA